MAEEQGSKDAFGRFIGVSSTMQKLYRKIKKFAASDSPTFITGDSGTGKEVCAQSIHSYSDRHQRAFISLNCAGLTEHMSDSAIFGHVKGAFTGAHQNRKGAIESAEGGTLFLDEIFDMPLTTQAKLLRFCQDYNYQKLGSDKIQQANVRLICATNRNPESDIEQGLFREDLYYRLNVIPLQIPALKNRGEDVLDIAHFYLREYAKIQNKSFQNFSDNAQQCLLRYSWPGNIREVQNVLRYLVSNYDRKIVTADMLPNKITKTAFHSTHNNNSETLKAVMPLRHVEKQVIEKAIKLSNGNISKAAAMLDVAPSTIYRKIQTWKEKVQE